MALWNLAARDELAVQPASRHVADLLLVACNLYVDLTALQTAFMKQLRPFYSLYADAEHARRATEEEDSASVLESDVGHRAAATLPTRPLPRHALPPARPRDGPGPPAGRPRTMR